MDKGAESSDDLSEWEQIDSPFSPHRSISPPRMAEIQPNEDHSPNSPSSSSSSSSPTPVVSSSSSNNLKPDEEEARRRPESDSRLAAVKEFKKQLRLRLGILKTDVLGAAAKVWNYRLVAVWRFWSAVSVAGAVTAVLLSLMYAKLWRPRRRPRLLPRRRENNEALLLLLKEKDEKISQLLVQIAQMNEALSARRRVPVIRVG